MTQKSLSLHCIYYLLYIFHMTAVHSPDYILIKKNWLHIFSKIVLWLYNLNTWLSSIHTEYLPYQLTSNAPAEVLSWWFYNSKSSILNRSASLFRKNMSRPLFLVLCNGTRISFFIHHNGSKVSAVLFFLFLTKQSNLLE